MAILLNHSLLVASKHAARCRRCPLRAHQAGVAASSSLAGATAAGAAGVDYCEGGAVAAATATAVGGGAGTLAEEILGKGDSAALDNQQQQQQQRDVSLLEGGGATGAADPRSLFTIMGLCFLVAIVCALDRVAMSVAIVPMGNVYDYSETTKGLVREESRVSARRVNAKVSGSISSTRPTCSTGKSQSVPLPPRCCRLLHRSAASFRGDTWHPWCRPPCSSACGGPN